MNNTRIPAAMDIFTGNARKVAVMLQEIFDVFVHQPLYKVAPKMFAWFDTILKQYGQSLPREIFYDGNLADLWSHFQSGFCLFCIIYHLHGNVLVGEGSGAVRIDSMRVYSNPANIVEFRSNIAYVFSLLAALNIEILWDMEDWITFADTEFVVLQLFYVYDKLQMRQCSLPPAQGTSAGVTSGANGEPQVTGMIYADTRPGKAHARKHKTVLLGSGDDSLVGLPIDRTGDTEISAHRFFLPPAGLMTANSRTAAAAAGPSFVETKPNASSSSSSSQQPRLDWNSSATTTSMIESRHETRYVDALRRDRASSSAPASSPDGRTNRSALLGTAAPAAGSGSLSNASLVAAMEELEKAMTEAQKELEDQEDDLAARFLDLESRGAGFIAPAEYKVRFDNLEREAILLAEERVKLQEHFSLRLASIRQQHAENVERNTSQGGVGGSSSPPATPNSKGAAHTSGGGGGDFFSPLNTSMGSSVSSRRLGGKSSAVQQVQMKKAERGWNAHSKRRDTYNFALGKMQEEAQSALKNMWDPTKSIKEQLKSREQKQKRGAEGLNAPENNVPLEVSVVWRKFTGKLKSDADKWANQIRIREEARRWNAEQEVSAALETPVKVGIPIKSSFNATAARHKRYSATGNARSGGGLGLQDEATAAAIRTIEKGAMEREELYRRAYLRERGQSGTIMKSTPNPLVSAKKTVVVAPPKSGPFEWSTPSAARPEDPNKAVATPNAAAVAAAQNGSGIASSALNKSAKKSTRATGHPASSLSNSSDVTLESAVTFITSSQRFFLADRYVRKEYFWKVSSEIFEGKPSYVLKWRDMESDAVAGHLFLNDISGVSFSPINPCLLEITVGTSSKALLGTGGRAVVSLLFSSDADCKKYGKCLKLLQGV